MAIEIKEVLTEKDFKNFVDVQFNIYKNNKYWVPPIKKRRSKSIKISI
jgi:hypothetical protein